MLPAKKNDRPLNWFEGFTLDLCYLSLYIDGDPSAAIEESSVVEPLVVEESTSVEESPVDNDDGSSSDEVTEVCDPNEKTGEGEFLLSTVATNFFPVVVGWVAVKRMD